MKFNVKIELKTKAKTLIIILLLTLSIATIINIQGKFPEANKEDEEINTSLPITPEYKYHYENDFDFYDYKYLIDPIGVYYDAAPIGVGSEWSQDPNDDLGLDLWFYNIQFPGRLKEFSKLAGLYVRSHNSFKKQNDPTLGAYIDFHIDIDLLNNYNPDHTEVRSLDIILSIYNATLEPLLLPVQLINIYNEEPQTGRFYIPNFDQYIASDGKVRFELSCFTYGFVELGEVGGLNFLLKFEGLRVIQMIKPKEPEVEKRSLIIVHGYSFASTPETPANWLTFLFAQEFLEAYDDIIVISYYGQFKAFRYSKDADGNWTETVIPRNEVINAYWKIEDIAGVLAQYIVQDVLQIEENVDFITHSMGGLVIRYMIKHFYYDIINAYAIIGKNFTIKNVAMLAPPNHGGLWAYFWIDTQANQMEASSDFLADLNYNPLIWPIEIPVRGLYINWFTYRSGLNKGFLLDINLRHDGMVAVGSVSLILQTIGITTTNNKGWYQLDHEEMRHNDMLKTVLFNDLIKPPAIIDEIFDGGTPGIIMKIEDLTLQPNYEAPGGKTLLSITLPPEDANDIDKTSFTLYISTYIYQMTLKAGTTDTYEVELPLAEGDYPFSITAELAVPDGRLYQMSGNLIIIDDDVMPPEIQIEPGDLSISDEDAVGGILIEWEISDYSGIAEANVLLNGVEIRTYTNQGTITDSYLLPNELGVYTISIWARDNDDDPEHVPPGEDWSENSTERTITIYDDDINPPDIQITPVDLSISDEEAIGGVLISWEISDDSGISEANVTLNGVEIRSYANQGTITDSYLLPNEPGVYSISIWAKDNDNDLEDDWSEYSIEKEFAIYDDDLNPPDIQITPGDLTISVGEAEGGILVEWEISDYSGISEANVLLNGTEIRSYANQGTITDSFLLANEPGVYNFSIWAKDNDNDLEDDWLEYSTRISITIYEDDTPPPAIPGYSIFVLLGIFSVVIIIISKKRRNYRI